MKIEGDRTPVHTTRNEFDAELKRAGITLSPFPFEREFNSFEEATDVILYRCIKGHFNPRYENKDWSFNPQHALEYTNPVEGSTNTLLIIQVSKEDLRQNVEFYSKQGDKIGLKQSPNGMSIAKTALSGEVILFNRNVLRCMRQVIRFDVDPDNSMDRGFSDEFEPDDLKFKTVLFEWQMGVSMASRSDLVIPLPRKVVLDYNVRRGDSAEIKL